MKRLAGKKKGSNSFNRTQKHRDNFINWSFNRLDLSDINQLNREEIKNLRYKSSSGRFMSHWTYTDIFGKLDMKCEEQDVLVNQVCPTYTSQRCSRCGWVRKANRKRKRFKCVSCGFAACADDNASLNLSLNLRVIGKKERLLRKNRVGFYWHEVGQERIIPDTQKRKKVEKVKNFI